MGQMEYYRRPRLAGNNLPRISYATVRGSIRRSDPDGSSTVPYFPSFPGGGGSLQVVIDGGAPTNITINSASMLDVLSGLNTAFARTPPAPAIARAFEEDGCVSIQTLTKGAGGSVAVVGGSAATALGFYTHLMVARSTGGDIASGPESRLGNPFGTVFPAKGENLSTISFQRALGRLAGNSDVLFSELSRIGMKLAFVGTVSSQTVLTASSAALNVVGTLFTGYGLLSSSSTPEDLAPYFFLTDPVTKCPAASRVVAVVRGAVSGDPPYTNAPDLSGAGNVLGQSFLRSGPVPIEGIFDGYVMFNGSGGFGSAQAGDLVGIDGADNTINSSPWDNRGMRWVVEEVSGDGSQCSVRPMSQLELELFGTSTSEEQPILELNGDKAAGQSFGTASFFSGTFLSSVRLIVNPPLAPGASCDVWAGVPLSFRDQHGYEMAGQAAPLFRSFISTSDPSPNSLLTRPSLSTVASKLRVGQFLARLHGRVISIPQVDLTGPGVAVWDEMDGQAKIVGSASSTQHIIATGVGGLGTYTAACRIEASLARTATVGAKGQFADLSSALAYANAYGQGTGERFEVLLLENQTAPSGGWPVGVGMRIRGANGDITLTWTATAYFNFLAGVELVVEDVIADMTKQMVTGVAGGLDIRNVRYSGRSYQDSNTILDLGAGATEVDIGKSGAFTKVRGKLDVAGVATAQNAPASSTELVRKQELDAEATRATGVESTLTTNLAAEATRATAAESTLTTNLAAEATRATAAEALKAPLASPTFTGTVTIPALTGSEGDNVAVNKKYLSDTYSLKNNGTHTGQTSIDQVVVGTSILFGTMSDGLYMQDTFWERKGTANNWLLLSNLAAGSTNSDFTIGARANRMAGSVVTIENDFDGTKKKLLDVRYDGLLSGYRATIDADADLTLTTKKYVDDRAPHAFTWAVFGEAVWHSKTIAAGFQSPGLDTAALEVAGLSTQTGGIIIPYTGKWRVTISLHITTPATGDWHASVTALKNGSTLTDHGGADLMAQLSHESATGLIQTASMSAICDLAATDLISLQVWSGASSGSTGDFRVAAEYLHT